MSCGIYQHHALTTFLTEKRKEKQLLINVVFLSHKELDIMAKCQDSVLTSTENIFLKVPWNYRVIKIIFVLKLERKSGCEWKSFLSKNTRAALNANGALCSSLRWFPLSLSSPEPEEGGWGVDGWVCRVHLPAQTRVPAPLGGRRRRAEGASQQPQLQKLQVVHERGGLGLAKVLPTSGASSSCLGRGKFVLWHVQFGFLRLPMCLGCCE